MTQMRWKEPYLNVTVSCTRCQQELVVQMRARSGFRSINLQSVKCTKCENTFGVLIPDEILGGPFLPQP
jgi:transcription elongation factor Elf1